MKPSTSTGKRLALGCLALVLAAAALIAWQARMFEPRVQQLVRQLQTAKQAEDRGAAAKALGKMGTAARSAAPALVAALRDEGMYVTVLMIFPTEHYVSQDAFDALKLIGGPETVDALAEAMVASSQRVKNGSDDWNARFDSLPPKLLAHFREDSRPAAERVLNAIDGCKQGEVVLNAVNAVGSMNLEPGTPAAAKARQVLPQFCNWSGLTGYLAAWTLHRLFPDDDEFLAMYVHASLSQSHPTVSVTLNERTIPLVIANLAQGTRNNAIQQLGAAEPAQVLSPLRAALNDPEPRIRSGAALALARHGSEAAAAEPELADLLADEGTPVRAAAAIALWHVSGRVGTTVPLIAAGLASQDPTARQESKEFFEQRGPKDAWAAPALGKLASAGNPKDDRLVALRILAQIGPAASAASPALLECLKDEDEGIQRAAAKAVAALERK
jgi:HEAT repeat protein